jgi:hypothetical protein
MIRGRLAILPRAPGGLPERPMGADCKSVAKASKVRILHPPPRASDQRKRGRRPFVLTGPGHVRTDAARIREGPDLVAGLVDDTPPERARLLGASRSRHLHQFGNFDIKAISTRLTAYRQAQPYVNGMMCTLRASGMLVAGSPEQKGATHESRRRASQGRAQGTRPEGGPSRAHVAARRSGFAPYRDARPHRCGLRPRSRVTRFSMEREMLGHLNITHPVMASAARSRPRGAAAPALA